MKFLQKITFLDYFKSFPYFYFDSSSKISTEVGIIISLFIYAYLFLSFFQSNMFLRQNPYLSFSEELSQKKHLNLDYTNFSPLFSVYDQTKNEIIEYDPTFLNFSIVQTNIHTIKKLYTFTKCNEGSFDESALQNSLGLNVSQMNRSNFLCINETIQINFGENFSPGDSLLININRCHNGTEIVCQELYKIENYLIDKVIIINYRKDIFQPDSYEKPFYHTFQTIKILYFYEKKITLPIEIIEIDFKQDKNILFKENENFLFIEDKTLPVITETILNIDDPFYTLYFSLSKTKKKVTRKYEKLTETLGKLGGMAHVFHLLGDSLVKLFAYLKIMNTTLRKLFKFSSNSLINIKRKSMKNQDISTENNKIEINCMNLNKFQGLKRSLENNRGYEEKKELKLIEMNELSKEKTQIPKFSPKNTHFFRISIYKYIKFLIKNMCNCELNEEERLIEYCEKEFKNQFDILMILKKIKNFEYFQEVLMDNNQFVLFKYLQNEQHIFEEYPNLHSSEKQKQENIIKIIEEIKSKKNKAKIDKKLLIEYEKNFS